MLNIKDDKIKKVIKPMLILWQIKPLSKSMWVLEKAATGKRD